jgi:hypothetical protein
LSYSSVSSSTSIPRSWRDTRKLLDRPEEELFLFDRLAERQIANPQHNREANGLKGVKNREKAKPLYTAEVSCLRDPVSGSARAHSLYISDGRAVRVVRLEGRARAIARALQAVLAPLESNALVVFALGARRDFHLLLLGCGRALAEQGWRIHPLASHSDIRGLVLTFGERSWWFCDAEAMTGAPVDGAIRPPLDDSGPEDARELRLLRLYQSLDRLQVLARESIGVALHVTVGAAGIAAARQVLPTGFIWWKPPALLREACLRGGAYRGGWQFAEPHSGEAWKVDITRSYTWALSLPLPCRSAFGSGYQGDKEAPGIFLCRVKGNSELPLPLSLWDSDVGEFRKQNVRVANSLAFLPQTEYSSVRMLGYDVQPLAGWRFAQHLSLSPLTDRLAGIVRGYPREDLFSQFAKALANSLAGKLGQGPLQDEVCYSADRPDAGWWPFITPDGEVIPYLWARPARVHRAYQHADAAAIVTARVRARTMAFAHEWNRSKGRVVYADTDGLLLTADSRPDLPVSNGGLGDWRLLGRDLKCEVISRKHYRWLGVEHPLVARDMDMRGLAVFRQLGILSVDGHIMSRPWTRAHQYGEHPADVL